MTPQRGELALVEFFRQAAKCDPRRVPIGIGDDMAAIRTLSDLILITADMLLDGVHFDTTVHTPEQIGRKAIACSLSDCAAMACKPVAATASVALNANMNPEHARRLFMGMKKIATEFDCEIVGGDTTSWNSPLVIDVCMLAEPATPRGPVRRDGARPGDDLYVTGQLGGSLAGKHMSFRPRMEEALVLTNALGPKLHAMMDLSDGLSLDLHRMCDASGTGAELEAARLDAIISEAALAAQDGRSPREHALTDGEDFELLFATEADAKIPALSVQCKKVGRVTDSGLMLRLPNGMVESLPIGGYEHFE